jgi:hypothetical protein
MKLINKESYLSYQVVFILNFLGCYAAMKSVSWWLNASSQGPTLRSRFILSPYLSFRSLSHFPSSRSRVVLRFLLFTLLTAGVLVLSQKFLKAPSYWEIMLISPSIYFLTEAVGALGQLLFTFNPTLSIHRSPLIALSLSHFWGRDWNLWVQDWLREVTQNTARGRRGHRIIYVFLISGIFHELMANLPYWLVYRKSYFGTMMAYFLIQAMALWIDKNFVSNWPHWGRRIYLWLAVILPSPLFINLPLLTFLGLRHE